MLAGSATDHASAVGTPSRAAARWAERVLVSVRPWANHSPAAIAAAAEFTTPSIASALLVCFVIHRVSILDTLCLAVVMSVRRGETRARGREAFSP